MRWRRGCNRTTAAAARRAASVRRHPPRPTTDDTASCSLREGQCTAVAWRYRWAHWDWPAYAPGASPPTAIADLAAAAVDALAPLVLALPRAAPVIPAGRFPSFVIKGIAGYRLARGPKGS
jgi:hypothetical protein